MYLTRKIRNSQPSIIYEVASTVSRANNSSHGDEFFNQIAIRSFMVLSISAIAADIMMVVERFI